MDQSLFTISTFEYKHTLFLLVLIITAPFYSFSQSKSSIRAQQTDSQITINGILDEEAWLNGEPVTDFIQFEPFTDTPSLRQTEVRVLFGDNNLYIGAILFDDHDAVENTLGRRDEYNHADWFLISVDSYFNRRIAYTFGVNAGGVQLDGQLNENLRDGGRLISGLDLSWNAVWYSSVKINDQGWVAEIRIPYSMLRFSNSENQTWGIHFTRRIARLGEVSEWPFIPISERSNFVAQFGHLTDIKNIEPKKEFQFRPHVLSQINTDESVNQPGKTTYSNNIDVGGDIKLGIGPNVMLDATINPDFGQVESDPAVLNLTAFETRLDENRPFFLEGADIFRFGIGRSQVFHSRRIGAKDHILGATKISGRSAKGLSFGFLGAATGNNLNSPSGYGVGRISQQLGEYSSAGAIVTNYYSPVQEYGWHSSTGGVDWDFRFAGNNYGFEGIAAFANRNSLIPDRSNETGYMGGLVFRKRQGSFSGHVTFLVFSDQYNPNDLGWITVERDFRNVWINTTYNLNDGRAFGPFQRASINTYNTQRVSYAEWLNIGDRNRIGAEFVTRNFQTIKFSSMFEDIFGGYDLFETRGLGHWARPSSVILTGEFITDQRRNWKISNEVEYTMLDNGGRKSALASEGRLDVGTMFSFSGNLEIKMENGVLAWMSNESFSQTNGNWYIGKSSVIPDLQDDEDFVLFDDRGLLEPILSEVEPHTTDLYYVPVFGERDTRSVDLIFRSALTFTNNLSFQIYNQLLLAKGKYENFQIMQNPDKLTLFNSYPKKADFSLSSFKVNMVLRWEYRAGSTLYLIWSHGRNEKDEINPLAPWDESPYDRSFDNQVIKTFNIFPRNAFILKINYTFLT